MRCVARVCAPRVAWCLALLAGLSSGCGAKTGLHVPDVTVEAGADAGNDGSDAGSDARQICVPPSDASTPIAVNLATQPELQVADIVFLVDRTGSMAGEIANIQNGLRSIIVPGLVAAIPDVHLGLVTFADFPVYPYGEPGDVPYTLEVPLSTNFSGLQGAIANIVAQGGGDNPESHVEALWETATGGGLRPYIPASGGCPTVGMGYPCFRQIAQAVIILFSDAEFHNGPLPQDTANPDDPYDPSAFLPYSPPHTYAQMLAALQAVVRPRVIGINSGPGDTPDTAHDDMVRLALDTQAIALDGSPLVYDISPDGSGLSEQVVSAIQQFQRETLFDISARPASLDAQNGASLITAVQPVSATPMGNIRSMDATTFYRVVPGTNLDFAVLIDPSRIVPTDQEQRIPVRIQFYGDGRPTLGFQDIVIIVPPRGHTACVMQ